MGGGSWSDADYRRSVRGKSAFAYSSDTLAKPIGEREPHQLLNPYGLKLRESRDSAEHPESNAVAIGLDVTGSMDRVVVAIKDSLGTLMEMLLGGEYISHPQLLFYAVGDASPVNRTDRPKGMCDEIPFQVSQFESDNRINDHLTKVVLEGGGGGQRTESYELGYYFAAYRTSIDCWEKRKKKGYLFTIGDEMPYPDVSKSEVEKIFGAMLEANIPLGTAVKDAKEKYNLFHIIPKGSQHYDEPDIRETWARLLGGYKRVLMLEDPSAVAETIALAIGLNESTVSFADGLKTIEKKAGRDKANAAAKALAEFAESVKNRPVKKRPASDKEDSAKAPKKGKPEWAL